MNQESIHPREGSHSTATSSRGSRGRTSTSITRTPSPSSQLQEYSNQLESAEGDHISSTDISSSTGTPSLLGSVWGLIRDAKGVAARELDKLLDHFPYKNASRSQSAVETAADIEDRVMGVRKPRSATSTLLASTSVRQPKSRLGHGPPVKSRNQPSVHRQQAFAAKLLDPDLREHVNNISPQTHVSTSLGIRPQEVANKITDTRTRDRISMSDMQIERGRQPSNKPSLERRIDDKLPPTKRSRDPSASDSDAPSNSGKSPLHGGKPQLKRDSSYSSYCSYSSRPTPHEPIMDLQDPNSSEDELQQGEESDLSDYVSVGHRRMRLSRGPSETPSISSMTGTLSISGSSRTFHRPPSRQLQNQISRRTQNGSRPHSSTARYSYHGESPESPSTVELLSGSHPNNLAGRETLTRKPVNRPVSFPSSTATESSYSPFSTPRNDIVAEQRHTRPPTLFSPSESEKLNELQQELAVIKEQLRSLVSARQDDLQRAQPSPSYENSREPPPPPPGPSSIGSKRWAPPQNQATQRMNSVLQELSSSTVQLRKTGSPFVSRISSAVDCSSSSEFTSVAVRSRNDSQTSTNGALRVDSLATPQMTIQSSNMLETPGSEGSSISAT
ncbi:hypothetical protein B0O80DRAFT_492136 [Mortierella sp. GBAus27b]|nr:hypothetical protein B0O80DRAFT_492136 [Mortierella sp. GBAus27b]